MLISSSRTRRRVPPGGRATDSSSARRPRRPRAATGRSRRRPRLHRGAGTARGDGGLRGGDPVDLGRVAVRRQRRPVGGGTLPACSSITLPAPGPRGCGRHGRPRGRRHRPGRRRADRGTRSRAPARPAAEQRTEVRDRGHPGRRSPARGPGRSPSSSSVDAEVGEVDGRAEHEPDVPEGLVGRRPVVVATSTTIPAATVRPARRALGQHRGLQDPGLRVRRRGEHEHAVAVLSGDGDRRRSSEPSPGRRRRSSRPPRAASPASSHASP